MAPLVSLDSKADPATPSSPSSRSAGSLPSSSPSRGGDGGSGMELAHDEKIAVALGKINGCLESNSNKHLLDIFKTVRKRLKRRIQEDNDTSALSIDVGQIIVNTMKRIPSNADLQQGGIQVLYYLAFTSVEFKANWIETISLAMSNHLKDSGVQEKAFSTLAVLAASKPDTQPALISSIERIIRAMETHEGNDRLLSSGMAAVCNLASNKSLQTTMGFAIPQILRITSSAEEHVREYACTALANASLDHSANQRLILESGVSVLLSTMREFPFNVSLQESVVEVLSSLATHELKAKLLSEECIEYITSIMKHHLLKESIQVVCCRMLSNLSSDSTTEVKSLMMSSIRSVLNAMRMYAQSYEIQFYGCCVLRDLSSMHHETISSLGSIGTIIVAMRQFTDRVELQEQAAATLLNLLSEGSVDDILSAASEGGISATLQALKCHGQNINIQFQCLGVLARLSSSISNSVEAIVSGGGVTSILTCMRDNQTHSHIVIMCCDILENISQLTDYHEVITSKDGIRLLVASMDNHSRNVVIQERGCCSLRNLSRCSENEDIIAKEGGIRIILSAMSHHPENAIIQSTGCDVLGRLARNEEHKATIVQENGVDLVLTAMKEYPSKSDIYERGCCLLVQLGNKRPASSFMQFQSASILLDGAPGGRTMKAARSLGNLMYKFGTNRKRLTQRVRTSRTSKTQ